MKYKYKEIRFLFELQINILGLMCWQLCAKRVSWNIWMLLSCHNIHVEILHLFQQDVSSHMQHRRQSSLLFSPCFCRDFYMLEIWYFSYLLDFFLTHFRPVLPLFRNQPIDLNCLLMTWFLNNENTGLNLVKENLTGCLDITPTRKLYLVPGKCFFSSAT